MTARAKYDAATFLVIAAALVLALMGGISMRASRAAQVTAAVTQPEDVSGFIGSAREPPQGGFGNIERERLVVVETEVKQIRLELAQVSEQLKFHLDPFSILLLLVVGGEKGWAVVKALKGGHKS